MHTTLSRLRALLPHHSDLMDVREAPRQDLLAGLTVAIVALPLALGFGAAAGLNPAAGLVTAIVAGVLGAVFGGSRLSVSGPTGAVTVVLIPVVAAHGPPGVFMLALLTGGVLLAMALLRAGRFVRFVPVPVIEGFTVGIAVVIFLQQVPAALGIDGEGSHVVPAAWSAVVGFASNPGWIDPAMAVGVAGVMLLGARWRPAVPFSLLAVAAATVAEFAGGFDVALIGELPKTLPAPSTDFFDASLVPALLAPAAAVAALVTLESLLGATVADRMSGTSRRHSPDRELFGQGIANLSCSLFGGMPASAAITRTVVNVRSGARSRMAAAWHAVMLAAFMLAAAPLVGHVPLSALAGVLLATTVKMVDSRSLAAVARATRADGAVLIVTIVATVALDLVWGVVIGLAVAGAIALVKLAASLRLHVEAPDAHHDHHDERAGRMAEHIAVFHLHGPLFFAARKDALLESCEGRTLSVVVLHLQNVTTMDASGALALCDFVDDLARRGVSVYMSGVRTDQHDTLTVLGVLEKVCTGDHLHGDVDQAVAAARRRLRQTGVL
ncbi:SulP family sulfate permease [Stackebrandtia albiflava]|uniref:SulP family sulfate permease n=1 Tax=Stackebrandtia albiflava TaxID=406432 RepID=A0A562UQX9_9ACTN|nr:SulP family inorganic anion transporter [Stackebrandtia albiflava]TWJ08019.1 SulP family sulfate permease [Stackebrandtia albiflava]